MPNLPPTKKATYNRLKHGYFGELGSGANASIKFLQTALTRDELDAITLIESIPGSEKWDVRDLFQRDVDKERVTSAILPYLTDPNRVKFFNPLTLVLLPLDDSQRQVEKNLRLIEPQRVEEGEHAYDVLDWPDFFQFRVHTANPAYSELKWNDQRVKVVAIDGQHRLSALKRWHKAPDGAAALSSWRIPVVILGIFKVDTKKDAATILEIVRKTFVYINTQAVEVNAARKILLDDEDIPAICAQELVEASHANDVQPPENRDPKRLPLIFFDWRGETANKVRVHAPAAVKSIEEIHGWFKSYLLPDLESQSALLGLDDLIPPIKLTSETVFNYDEAARIREQFRKRLLPAISFVLESFKPYNEYIAQSRRVENEALKEGDLAQHAFMRLRFGSAQCDETTLSDVEKKYEQLRGKFDTLKQELFPELISLDIGARALFSAFAALKRFYDAKQKKTVDWLDYAKWFVTGANKLCEQGWFESFDDLESEKRNVLKNLVFDASGQVINYKLNDVPGAGGALLALLLSRNAEKPSLDLEELWADLGDDLAAPLNRGYRREWRAKLSADFKGSRKEFNDEVKKKAEASVKKHLTLIRGLLGLT